MQLDEYGRQLLEEDDIISLFYQNPNMDLKKLNMSDSTMKKYNDACDMLYSDKKLNSIISDCTPTEFHRKNQKNWAMPKEYENFDIAEWCLKQCKNDVELQRTGQELLLYANRDMIDLLKFLHYFVAELRKNDIIWGIGRGSSTASYVLFLIGVHKIDSIYYGLEISEFFKDQ